MNGSYFREQSEMKAPDQESTAEIQILQSCINNLIEVFALPAKRTGGEAAGFVSRLLETLLDMLDLDFVYARLIETEEAPKEFVRFAESLESIVSTHDIGELVKPWLGKFPQNRAHLVNNPFSAGDLSIVISPLGAEGEFGHIAAASRRFDFPRQTEKLVIEVAVSRALIKLQEARIHGRQKPVDAKFNQVEAEGAKEELASVSERLKRKRAAPEQTEDDLRKGKGELHLVPENVPGLVALLSPTGEVEVVNRALTEYFAQTLAELNQWGTNGSVHPDDLPHVVEVFTRAIADGTPYVIQQRFRRFDGVYRWFENSGFPVRDAQGRITRWCVLLTDIDERKRAEEALAASERNLKLIIDTIPALAWSALPDGSADYFNQHYLDYIGFSAEQASGWGWTAAVHPEDREGLAAAWKSIMVSGEPGEAEGRLRRHDGEYRWFLQRANPMRDDTGRIVKWYGVNTDIEDRKRIEADLKRAYDSFADVQRLSKTGSYIADLVADDLTWSDELYRIFGFKPGSKLTRKRIRNTIHPDDLAAYDDIIARGISGENFDYQYRIVTRRGIMKHVRGTAFLVERIEGRPLFVGAIQDVTESVVAQEALDKARSDLAHVARATAMSALTASIAHEINQPLSGIITNASTCVRMLDADPPNIDGARETARRTIRDGSRAADVINRLRDLFKKKDFAVEAVDLNDAAREVLELSRNELQRNRIALRTELDENLPPIAGDRIQLQQVILNLILNAVEAMSEVNDRPRQLTIKTESNGKEEVKLSVRDLGVGFGTDESEKLFGAFYTTKKSGMGIGLSVSRSIIEKHRGRLWAEPNEGPGVVFSFSIPALIKSEINRSLK